MHTIIMISMLIIYYRKKSDNECVIRYIEVNKPTIAPLQIKINNFLGEINKLKNNVTLVSIHSDDKKLFKKLREIWNGVIKIIGKNNANDFVKNTIDDNITSTSKN